MNVTIGKEVKLTGKADLWTLQFEYWLKEEGIKTAAKKMKAKGVPCSMVIGWMRVRNENANVFDTCMRDLDWA